MITDISNSLVLGTVSGIVSGLLTATLLWVINNFRVKTFTPWYEKRVYKGVNIQGAWKLLDETESPAWEQHETINLIQTAHRLTGSLNLVPRANSKVASVLLSVNGEISDRFVSLTLRSPDSKRLSYSVLLLEIVGDGNTLRGGSVVYDINNEKISTFDVEYKR